MMLLRRLLRHALIVPLILIPGLVRLVLALVPTRFRPHSIFMLYPGRPAELPGYCPAPLLPLTRTRLFWSRPVPLGIVFLGWRPVSLVMGVPNDQKSLLAGKAEVELILSRVQAARQSFGVRCVALAGQLPSIIIRHGLPRDPSIVQGVAGAVFIVTTCLRLVLVRHGLGSRARVAVFGAGLVGRALIGHLQTQGYDVVGIDKSPHGPDIYPVNEAAPILAKTDVVVLLSARGSDFRPYVPLLKDGAVILDDTHPAFPRAHLLTTNGERHAPIACYRAVATHSELRIVPSLPGFDADCIPGCALEGVVVAEANMTGAMTQADFDAAAEAFGFRGMAK